MNAKLAARLAELNRAHHGRFPLRMKKLVDDLLKETGRLGLPEPSAIFAEPAGCLQMVWQGAEGRATVYTDEGFYAIEVVPRGPYQPFTAIEVSVAGAYLAGLFVDFGPLDAG